MEYSRHSSKTGSMKSSLTWIIIMCALAFLLLYINANILTITLIRGNSMYPTVEDGEILLVDKIHRDMSRGDIILAKTMNSGRQYIIKRVIATGGEEITIDYSKNDVLVDEVLLSEPYISLAEADPMVDLDGVTTINYTVPDGYVFVMGDNRNYSMDSRNEEIGFISMDEIIGKVITP